MGYTPPNNPSVNYTASNADPNKFVSLQVKELGNSIGLITNQFPEEVNNTPNSPENNEPGTHLLDCYNKGGPGR